MINKLKTAWEWFTVGKPVPPLVDQNGELLPPPTEDQARKIFRDALTNRVENGWKIEIENQFDAVLSRKRETSWISKLIIFLLLLLIFAPLAIFYLVVVIIKGVNGKPVTQRLWIDENGRIQQR